MLWRPSCGRDNIEHRDVLRVFKRRRRDHVGDALSIRRDAHIRNRSKAHQIVNRYLGRARRKCAATNQSPKKQTKFSSHPTPSRRAFLHRPMGLLSDFVHAGIRRTGPQQTQQGKLDKRPGGEYIALVPRSGIFLSVIFVSDCSLIGFPWEHSRSEWGEAMNEPKGTGRNLHVILKSWRLEE